MATLATSAQRYQHKFPSLYALWEATMHLHLEYKPSTLTEKKQTPRLGMILVNLKNAGKPIHVGRESDH